MDVYYDVLDLIADKLASIGEGITKIEYLCRILERFSVEVDADAVGASYDETNHILSVEICVEAPTIKRDSAFWELKDVVQETKIDRMEDGALDLPIDIGNKSHPTVSFIFEMVC